MAEETLIEYGIEENKKPRLTSKKIKNKTHFFDIVVYSAIIALFLFTLISWDYSGSDFGVVLSFFVNGMVYSYFAIHTAESITLKRNMYIFLLIFFFFAPLQQYLEGTILWSGNGLNLKYTSNDYITLNIIMLLYVLLFELGYRRSVSDWKIGRGVFRKSTNGQLALLVFITITACILSKFIGSFIHFKSSAMMSQINNVFIFAPISCLLIALSIQEKRKIDKMCIALIAIIAIGSLVALSGSLARFILLGAIMTIISYITKRFQRKSIYFAGYIFGFFFLFSALRLTSLLEIKFNNFINFNHVDFDAYQIMLAAMEYIGEEGISWGQNILSAIACFIPRSIAGWRLEASGGIIMDHFGSWFENVSCPLPAEMLFAFGIPGLFVMSYLFGWLLKKLDAIDLSRGDVLVGFYCIISGVSIYLMRGALLPTFSFSVGIVLSYFVLFKFMNTRIKK